jgi:AhpD family alkylhydroperoxidase
VISEQIDFENVRFDPDLSDFHELAKQMAAGFGYTAKLSIGDRLAALLRLRVAQINPCSYCLILHPRIAVEVGIGAAMVAHLASWRQSTMFSGSEALALAYCEALTRYEHEHFDEMHQGLTVFFDEREIAEIAAVVINMNVWTRLKLAQGSVPVVSPGGEESARDAERPGVRGKKGNPS